MKRLSLLVLAAATFFAASAQEFSVGADYVTKYIFRGAVQDAGPAFQPTVEFSTGNLAIGAWGSYKTGEFGLDEADLYISYGLDNGLSLGLTDYYYPGTSWLDFDKASSKHSIEVNLGYETGALSIAANYIANESLNTLDGTMYFELGYALNDNVSLFVGGGNGWVVYPKYVENTEDLQITNIGLSVSKEIAITEKFSLPVFGQAIFNPNTEMFNMVFGFSL